MTATTSPQAHHLTIDHARVRPTLLHRLIGTERSTAMLALRLVLALVMFPHGAQKVLGWFGGYGFSATLGYFTATLGVPTALAVLVVSAEFLGSIGLAIGAFSRVAAAGLVAVMTGAIFLVHLPNGFFMNWTGAQAGEGYEYHLLVIGMSIAIALAGSGRWSLDRWLASKV